MTAKMEGSQVEGHIGQSTLRVEGRDKVLGRTRYTADFPVVSLAHAVLVQATIARGAVIEYQLADALAAPGVLHILTADNCPALKRLPQELTRDLPAERRPPLADREVHYAGQHLALVVANTLEEAQFAASLLAFRYENKLPISSAAAAFHEQAQAINHGQVQSGTYQPDHFTRIEAEKLQYHRGPRPPKSKVAAWVAATYTTPVEHHNPIETCATIAVWEGEQLTLRDTTRWLLGSRKTIAAYLDLPETQIRIVCPFLGGAFGSKGFLWQHSVLAAVAARQLSRPVKLVLSRAQMFTSVGHRPETLQQVQLLADAEGRLLSTEHHTLSETSPVAHFVEPAGLNSRNLYASPHAAISHTVARIHRATPVFMRAPGEAPGIFALETAMDELAYTFNPPLDPLAFRLKNHADLDQDGDKPFASKHLRECYAVAARKFGWEHRPVQPRSLSRNCLLIGQGMATATYPGRRMAASAGACLDLDGCLTVTVATHELGNGVRTVLTQIAADGLGLSLANVRVLTGDSNFPEAPFTGASQTSASTGPAVQQAVAAIRARLINLAVDNPDSPVYRVPPQFVQLEAGRLGHGGRWESIRECLARHGQPINVEAQAKPSEQMEDQTHQSFGAHFVEVEVDESAGRVRVARWVGAYDAGRILNPQLAGSQILGGVIFGIGMALMEETVYDPETGMVLNPNLAEYHVPVHADVPDFDITLLDYPDDTLNPLGVRGIGELGIVGAAAAIANAIFHATGRRHRQLPIRPEHVFSFL